MGDAERLKLLQQQRPSQYGQSFEVLPTQASVTTANLASNVVRWDSEGKWDVSPWRVYLRPWQPRTNVTIQAINPIVAYALPTPWSPGPTVPNERTTAGRFTSFADLQIFARVSWGCDGVIHEAYVDWPTRGLLFQVVGQYVQIDAVGRPSDPSAANILPVLGASIGPEPGGGDAASPATFTYVRQLNSGSDATFSPAFVIPPFAREFEIVVDWDALIADGCTEMIIRAAQNADLVFSQQTWVFDPSTDSSVQTLKFPVDTLASIITIEHNAGGQHAFGMRFLLDL